MESQNRETRQHFNGTEGQKTSYNPCKPEAKLESISSYSGLETISAGSFVIVWSVGESL